MPCLLSALVLATVTPGADASYDPLTVSEAKVTRLDLTVGDAKRKRDIPVYVYLPAGKLPAAVVLFSHGLGGARGNNVYLAEHWARRGYAAVFLQHPGSDEGVWQDVPARQRMAAMKKAAGVQNFQLRVNDVPAVLDQLERWTADRSHPLFGRLDLEHVGMSGHSFGAVTTQAVSGQAFPGGLTFTDPRIDAAVALSPSVPQRGDAAKSFGGVKLPWLLMTGTEDNAAVGDADIKNRLSVYPALPKGDKYELVLDKAEHSAFSERALPGDRQKRNPNHHRAVRAVTTAFWDAYLGGDAAAKAWLGGDAVRGVLEPADRWQAK